MLTKDGNFFPFGIEKLSQTSQKAGFGNYVWESWFYLFTGPRPMQDGSWDAFLLSLIMAGMCRALFPI